MPQFSLVSEININDEATFKDKMFISLDIDWAHDEVIRFCASILKKNKVKATWYVTHDTPVLDELRNNDLFELGIHPNFNKILDGNFENGRNIEEILDNILKIVPEAKSFRCHSLTQNSTIFYAAYNRGLFYDLNTLIPISSNIEIIPYYHTSKVMQLPHLWEDDVHYLNNWSYSEMVNKVKKHKGLKILDFHPIHIFLNTEKDERHIDSKPYHKNFNELKRFVNHKGYGTRDFLMDLMSGK